MKNNKSVRNIALCGIFLSTALIFSYVEFLFPLSFTQFIIPLPGIKLGLANIVTITAFFFAGKKEAFVIMVLRCAITSLLFGNITSFLFSLFGGIMSFIVMTVMLSSKLNLYNRFYSLAGVSVMSALFHNSGQILAALLILKSSEVIHYYPILMLSSVVTGFITGIVSIGLINNLRKLKLNL